MKRKESIVDLAEYEAKIGLGGAEEEESRLLTRRPTGLTLEVGEGRQVAADCGIINDVDGRTVSHRPFKIGVESLNPQRRQHGLLRLPLHLSFRGAELGVPDKL